MFKIPNVNQEVFDMVGELNKSQKAYKFSVQAIDFRICEIEIITKKALPGFKKRELVISDNLTYREAYMLLKGFSYGWFLPS